MHFRIGNWMERARDTILDNFRQRQSGLIVPPDYIAGKHFGGFSGYESWIQDCIRMSCEAVRGVGKEELAELTCIASWQGVQPDGSTSVTVWPLKHAEALDRLEKLAERIDHTTGKSSGLSAAAKEQLHRVQGSRENGTLVVCAMNPVDAAKSVSGELKFSFSAWNPADVEEAKNVPKQKYLLG